MSADASRESPIQGSARAGSGPSPDQLRHEFEELGLTRYEAAVLVAVLQVGSARSSRLAAASGVPRTSAYQVLDELSAKGLVERMPGTGPAIWMSPGVDEVLDRAVAAVAASQSERLRRVRDRADKVREMLADVAPEPGGEPSPYVHTIRSPARAERAWDQLVDSAEDELVMFVRPPYLYADPNPKVLDMLERGVRARVLYQAGAVDAPDAQGWLDAYHRAGVQARLVDELTLKMIVVDRRASMVATTHPSQEGYPTVMLIEHPGFAEVLADSFERRWERALPYRRDDLEDGNDAEDQRRTTTTTATTSTKADTP